MFSFSFLNAFLSRITAPARYGGADKNEPAVESVVMILDPQQGAWHIHRNGTFRKSFCFLFSGSGI